MCMHSEVCVCSFCPASLKIAYAPPRMRTDFLFDFQKIIIIIIIKINKFSFLVFIFYFLEPSFETTCLYLLEQRFYHAYYYITFMSVPDCSCIMFLTCLQISMHPMHHFVAHLLDVYLLPCDYYTCVYMLHASTTCIGPLSLGRPSASRVNTWSIFA